MGLEKFDPTLAGHDLVQDIKWNPKLREEFKRNPWNMLAALMATPVINALRARMDPARYNGATLVGLKGIVIKSHGSADKRAFAHALDSALEEVRHDVPQRIAQQMAKLAVAAA